MSKSGPVGITILLTFVGVALGAGLGALYGSVPIGLTGGAGAGLMISVIVNAVRG